MAFLLIVAAVFLVVTAIRNTHEQLFQALGVDAPAFVVWAAALVAVAALGYVPGLKPVSRGLLALVLLVIFLKNYRNILDSLTGIASASAAQGQAGAAQGQAGASGGGGLRFPSGIIGTLTGSGGSDSATGSGGWSSAGEAASSILSGFGAAP